jgi:type VI protein secretion system component VasK
MVLAADYPFLDVLWTMLVFFLWVSWFVLLFHVVGDVFRRRDIAGGKKTAWLLFLLFVPFVGVFAYLIANSDEMARRNVEAESVAVREREEYIRAAAGSGSPADDIERAQSLLDRGVINQAEFDAIKAKALA